MRQITEQQIMALAPNPAAAANGKKISQKGGFVRLERSADDSFFLGECTGSGAKNYITSADFLDPGQPVFRCTCPSRQFPCKHSLALLYEMLSGKDFSVCDTPEDILQKRQKKEARAAKAAEKETEKQEKAPKKVNKAARLKKLQKQLEGLELTEKLIRELMTAGLGSMGGASLPTYRALAKQLGDHYLPGPQRILSCLILEIERFQREGDDHCYDGAIAYMEQLWSLTKKSKQYLSQKIQNGDAAPDDNLLFEELGGVWKFSELMELGLGKENLRLCQLAFWVEFDQGRKEYIDMGCWADIATGELSLTCNYRPVKALKYVKQEDSTMGVVSTPAAVFYPGSGARRVRWESGEIVSVSSADLASLREKAEKELAPVVKSSKNLLKDALSAPIDYRLLAYDAILRREDGALVLKDAKGDTVLLDDAPWMERTTQRLSLLSDSSLLTGQAMLGGFWYDREARRLKLQPLSVITPESIVRLLY